MGEGRSVVVTLAFLGSLVAPAAACTCGPTADGGWLIYPEAGEEVATDAALFWFGAQGEEAFGLTGPEGEVALDEEWWVSGTGYDVAVIRPQQRLFSGTSYTFSAGTTSSTFATGAEAASPTAVAAKLSSVCVEVGAGGQCLGIAFTLELPALDSGFYLAELTDEAGNAYRVLGDGDGVYPYHGLCYANLLDASGWETASVRVAVVSLAGDLGEWSRTFVGDIPVWGTQCLAVQADPVAAADDGCGCGVTSGGASAALLGAALVAAARRRRPAQRSGDGFPRSFVEECARNRIHHHAHAAGRAGGGVLVFHVGHGPDYPSLRSVEGETGVQPRYSVVELVAAGDTQRGIHADEGGRIAIARACSRALRLDRGKLRLVHPGGAAVEEEAGRRGDAGEREQDRHRHPVFAARGAGHPAEVSTSK